MSEVKIRIGLDKPGVDEGLKQTNDNLAKTGESATKAGAAARPALDSIGMSAKATAAAMRGVPAQFTDIITSIQGGQAPLTVLLQQGGQLKDMFGGVGPAAKALGTYIAGLISPTTLAVGAVGALALAYSKGAEEQENFTRTLILSGNASGATVGQLQTMSAQIASSTGVTRSMAAETVNGILASGKVSADSLVKVTQAALDLERVGGPAVADTIKQFTSLGDDPVKASLKLNDQTHYLTAAVYEQIRALADQGRTVDAARLAQTAYADAIESRIPQMAANLGVLEKAWRGVLGAIKGTGDAMLAFGRSESLEEKLAAVEKAIAKAKQPNQIDNGEVGLATLEKQRALLVAQVEDQGRINFRVAQGNVERESGLALAQKTSDLREKYLTKEQILEKEILAINASALTIEEKRNAIKMAREKSGGRDTSLDSLFARAEEAQRISKELDDELKGRQEALFAWSDEQRRIRKEADDESAERQKINEKDARARQIVTNYNAEASQLVGRIARQNELIGVSEREVKAREAVFKVEDAYAQITREITQQIPDLTERTKAQAAVDADLANKKMLVADATRQAYDASRTFDAGWSDALTKYQDNATNAADTARNAFSGMTGAMESALKSFVKNGKVDFKSFGDSVLNTLIDIQMQSLRTDILAPMMKSGGSWLKDLLGFGGGDSASSSNSGVAQMAGVFVGSAKGNVFSGAPDLHQYVNTVQTTPRVFGYDRLHAFAKGGIFAEEDPEAVMPLARDGQGRLGVRAQGGGGSVIVNVINNAAGTQAKQAQRSDGNGGSIIDVLIEQVDASMAANVQRGNGKLPAALERTYSLNRAAGN